MLHGFWGQKYWEDASAACKKVCGRRPPLSTPDYTSTLTPALIQFMVLTDANGWAEKQACCLIKAIIVLLKRGRREANYDVSYYFYRPYKAK